MPTLQRLHTTVAAPGAGLTLLSNRVVGYPGGQEKAVYPLGDGSITTAVGDAVAGNPATAAITASGGVATTLSASSGARLSGRAAIPQSQTTVVDITLPWTVWGALRAIPGDGTVWTLFQDYEIFRNAAHGFWIFAQSSGAVAAGDQISITVRMTKDGGLDFTNDYNLSLPQNSGFAYGKWMLVSVTHDGSGNITIQIWASNGKVAQGTKAFDIQKARGPVGNRTSVTRWQLGSIAADVPVPGLEVEGWGVLQRQWNDVDALKAYRNARSIALGRGRRWS